MDYKKAYEKAIERAKQGKPIDEIFPELKESEDEKIRKAIRIYLDWLDGRKDCAPRGEYSIMNMLAWLEKQGEQKPVDKIEPIYKIGDFVHCTTINGFEYTYIYKSNHGEVIHVFVNYSCGTHGVVSIDDTLFESSIFTKRKATKEEIDILFQKMKEEGYEWDTEKKELRKIEQKPTDKPEPKFKVGDWVIFTAGEFSTTLQIVNVDTDKKLYWFNDNSYLPIVDEECLHHWTIQDAKDGDVLATEVFIFIFKNIDNGNGVHYYCHYEINKHENDEQFDIALSQSLMGRVGNSISHYSPATKEQRDLLFQKMKEAGYEWDDEKKELRKIEQKSAWSEEDEKMLDSIIDCIDGAFIDSNQWVDLGLPSGTLWKNTNETNPNNNHDFYTYDEAMKKYGDQLPTKEQWDELKDCCEWTWESTGYKITGWNGNSIFLPIANYSDCNGHYVGFSGRYWSSKPNGSEFASILNFNSDEVFIGYCRRDYCRSVRLVK